MKEQCPFLNGNGTTQCHLTRSLLNARDNLGFAKEELRITQLKEMLCERENPQRTKDCPAFTDISSLGLRSQFARPITNNRPPS